MIIVKAPLRISLGGGGTDLPSYYERFGSTFYSAAIDKYVYISVHRVFADQIILKYSEMEKVADVGAIRHPIMREALAAADVTSGIEISSFADIPAGTGLGSSGAFTVALLKGLYAHTNRFHDNLELAEDACRIEIEKLGTPVGKQDQYVAAVGGLNRFDIDTAGRVSVSPVRIDRAARIDLEEHLLLFFTGFSRAAEDILRDQDTKTRAESGTMIESLHFVRELGTAIGAALERGDLVELARLMNVHWESKRKRSQGMSNDAIDDWYRKGLQHGALGGKLIGAGGGGFLMFVAEDKRRLRKAMRELGLHDVPFRFDGLGAQVVLREGT
jgi:D-glycero-alpha-D-manno-heptose-7-phosphate kinase